MWAQGSTSSRVRWRVTYQSGSRPSARIASSQRSRRKCSLHSWNVPPARHTASMTRPIRRSPRLTMPSANVARGSCHFTCAAVPLVASRSMPILRPELVDTVLAEPLERRVRLRHEPADRHRAARLLRVAAADVDHVVRQLRDAQRVVVHLGRQAGEEIELHPPPTLRVRGVDRVVEVVLEDQLVDDPAQAPRARLGRERQTRCAAPSGSRSRSSR